MSTCRANNPETCPYHREVYNTVPYLVLQERLAVNKATHSAIPRPFGRKTATVRDELSEEEIRLEVAIDATRTGRKELNTLIAEQQKKVDGAKGEQLGIEQYELEGLLERRVSAKELVMLREQSLARLNETRLSLDGRLGFKVSKLRRLEIAVDKELELLELNEDTDNLLDSLSGIKMTEDNVQRFWAYETLRGELRAYKATIRS